MLKEKRKNHCTESQVGTFSVKRPECLRQSTKVCLYAGSLLPGGAERQIAVLAKALSCHGINVHLICNRLDGINGHYLDMLKETGVKIHALSKDDLVGGVAWAKKNPSRFHSMNNFSLPRTAFICLLGRLAAIAPDILHCHLDGANCLGACAGLLAGVPGMLLSFRNVNPDSIGYRVVADWSLPIYKFLLPHANIRLEANSTQGAASYADWLGIPATKISINYNGVDQDTYRQADPELRGNIRHLLGMDDNTPLVLHLARYCARKRPDDMLDVAAQLCRQVEKVRFLVAGNEMELDKEFGSNVVRLTRMESLEFI